VTNTNPKIHDDERRQTPEDVLQRIAGVPKTLEEQQAEAAQLDEERTRQAQRMAGVDPNHPNQDSQPHTGTERQQRDKPV
jgi:hypothetical protein